MTEKLVSMIAVFNQEDNSNNIRIGEGFTVVESVVRAVGTHQEDEAIQNLIQTYGPDDIAGLYEYYEYRGLYLSDCYPMSDFTQSV